MKMSLEDIEQTEFFAVVNRFPILIPLFPLNKCKFLYPNVKNVNDVKIVIHV
eukprot:UN05264